MTGRWKRKQQSLLETFWEFDATSLSGWRAFCLKIARLAGAVARDFTDGRLSLWAMSLVYTTLLSLVPFLAISFSVLKGLGIHNQLEPWLLEFLRPMGAEGADIARRILGFVDNINVGVLGWVGVAILLYSVISTMHKVERAFNYIWNVAAGRRFIRRFSDYLSVLVIWPVTMAASVALTATLRFQWIAALDAAGLGPRMMPWILMTLAFTFIYMFMPNTRVKLLPALIGGMVAAALWKLLGVLFTVFVAGSADYAAIYSAFAALMLLIIWLYFGWLAVLIGADVAYYCQYPQNQKLLRGHLMLSNRVRERAALAICAAVGQRHEAGGKALTVSALADALRLPVLAVEEVIKALIAGHILAEVAGDRVGFVPARSFSGTTVFDVLAVLRSAHEKDGLDDDDFTAGNGADAVYRDIERVMREHFDAMPLDTLYRGKGERNA